MVSWDFEWDIPSGIIKHGLLEKPRTEWKVLIGKSPICTVLCKAGISFKKSPISMVHFPLPCLIKKGEREILEQQSEGNWLELSNKYGVSTIYQEFGGQFWRKHEE